jgi:hypothetical protein
MMDRLRRWRTPLALAAVLFLFWIASRGAYRGYFDSDDLDNLAWTRIATWHGFPQALFSPWFYESNFRPIGHFYFWLLGRIAGLQFWPYVATIHALHAVNVVILWLLLTRLQFAWSARLAGVVFFAFHMAAFDAYWKPMYVFDLACAALCLLSLLAWLHGKPVLTFLLFWLAYKSKELAVAVPFILLTYEILLSGLRRYRTLLPHAAVSVWFIAQALASKYGRQGDYAVRLTPATLMQAVDYYASGVLTAPHAGFALLALPVWFRDRRLWWGLAAAVLWLAPMLLVPGRMAWVYLYLPLAGVSIAIAAIAERVDKRWFAAGLALWIGFQFYQMRGLRRAALTDAAGVRAYVQSVVSLARIDPSLDTFLLDGTPAAMRPWGIEGALRYIFRREDLRLIHPSDPKRAEPPPDASLALLSWDAPNQRLIALRRSGTVSDAAFIEMTPLTPLWQLIDGWYHLEGGFRWTMPVATARLRRPDNAREFIVRINVPPAFLKGSQRYRLHVSLDGVEIGTRTLSQAGWITESFPLSATASPPGRALVTFQLDPPFQAGPSDPRPLGVAIGAFGFR